MKILKLMFIIASVMLVAGCNNAPAPTPKATPMTVMGAPNLLIAANGDVKIQRSGWVDYHSTNVGTLIQFDDILNVKGEARVLCGNLSMSDPISGRKAQICPVGSGYLKYQEAIYKSSATQITPDNIPYIQHPRHTLVLDRHPLLRWHDTGASSYTVAIETNGEKIWSDGAVTGHEVRYPNDDLEPTKNYLLVITDNDSHKVSTIEDIPNIGFQVIAEADRQAIEERVAKIKSISFPDEAVRDFTIAVHYASFEDTDSERGLWSEAELLLETITPSSNATAIYLWQGDILRNILLPHEAQASYEAALQQATDDLETQSAAHKGLWEVTRNKAHCETAIGLYESLGDTAQVKELQAECR